MAHTRQSFMRKFGKKGIDEETEPLLGADSLRSDFDQDQDGFDSLSSQVSSVKQLGRGARSGAEELHQRRRDQVGSAMVGMGKEAALGVVDGFVPGLGAGIGGALAVKNVVDAHKGGGSAAQAAAKEAVVTGASFIPVVGEFVGFVEDAYNGAKAIFQSDKARTAEKVEAARELKQKCHAGLDKIPGLRDQLASYSGKDKADLARRIDKAEARLRDGLKEADRWIAKKASKGTLPLLSGLDEEADGSDASL